jgi:type IV pilus assembly protein PilA
VLFRLVALIFLVVGGYYAHQKYEAWREVQRRHSHIAEGLMIGAGAKTKVIEYYLEEGEWPANNAALNLAPPEEIIGNSLQSVEIMANGVVRLSYDEKSGVEDGRILLIPHGGERHLAIRWECWTDSYPDINSWAPQCEYEAP